MRSRSVSVVLALLVACVVAIGIPVSAQAHDVLEKTSPSDGVTVATLPAEVTLTFSDAPMALGLQVLVTGPSGNMADGAAQINERTVTQRLLPAAPAGDYTVTYRVTSNDGHPIAGSFGFHATVGLDGSTATAGATVHAPPLDSPDVASAKESQFVPVMLTVASVIVLIAIAIVIVQRTRGRARP